MTDLQRWLKDTQTFGDRNRGRIVCPDGFNVSVQASEFHYSMPRDDGGTYSEVELGYPSEKVEEWKDYAEDGYNPSADYATKKQQALGMPAKEPEWNWQTVYAYVPVELVEKVLKQHGWKYERKDS